MRNEVTRIVPAADTSRVGGRRIPVPARRAEGAPDAALARLAARQHGVVSTEQLHAIGIGPAATTRRVAHGRLHRVHRGVYAVGHARLSQRGHWMAATLAAGAGSALSHHAAAVCWGIWPRACPRIDVITLRDIGDLPGVCFHRSRCIPSREVTSSGGIPITTVARTIVDLADVMTPHQLTKVLHEAAFRSRLNLRQLRSIGERLRNRPGRCVLEAAVELYASGSSGTRSQLEDRLLDLLAAAGISTPRVNVRAATPTRHIEVDFRWVAERVCVEVDGPGHRLPDTQRDDDERDRLMLAAGYITLRFSASDVKRRARSVTAQIASALRGRADLDQP